MTAKRKKRPQQRPVGTGVGGANAYRSPKPPIERIPFFGATWYKRGIAYWTLRVVAVFLLLMLLGVSTAMTFGLGYGFWTLSVALAMRVIVLVIIAAAIVRSMIKAWSAFIRVGRSRRSGHEITLGEAAGDTSSPLARRRAGWAGSTTGVMAMMGSAVAGGFLVISVVFNFGWALVMFVSAFPVLRPGVPRPRPRPAVVRRPRHAEPTDPGSPMIRKQMPRQRVRPRFVVVRRGDRHSADSQPRA